MTILPCSCPSRTQSGTLTYGSIKEHQGTIAVENRPDEGALFLIQLPLEP